MIFLVQNPSKLFFTVEITKENCRRSTVGWEYASITSVTVSNRTCQRWNESTPHGHRFTSSLADQGNYCRNPDREPKGPWCYTTDPTKRWEYCDIPKCGKIAHVIHFSRTLTLRIYQIRVCSSLILAYEHIQNVSYSFQKVFFFSLNDCNIYDLLLCK